MNSHRVRNTAALSVVLILAACASAGVDLETTDSALVAQIQQCEACHQSAAAFDDGVPALNGMPSDYLEDQIDNFKSGRRGGGDTDLSIAQMNQQFATLSATSRKRIAAYFASQSPMDSPRSITGNASAGEPLFDENCAGCHNSSLGRLFTGSPPIAQLPGNYILAQLQKFANGQRSFKKSGKHKAKMIEVVKRFETDELADITAYIKTLRL